MFAKTIEKVIAMILVALVILVLVFQVMDFNGINEIKARMGIVEVRLSNLVDSNQEDLSIENDNGYITVIDDAGTIGTYISTGVGWYRVLVTPNGGSIYRVANAHLYPSDGLTAYEITEDHSGESLLLLADPNDTISLSLQKNIDETYLVYSSCADGEEECTSATAIMKIP